ncbi:hypothetical protein HPB47_001893 [Ixodes persulcatus]|uniref:Uncharacterized protein n=1 Tax=Ixodes persulcatus TaxID=34615 RepID=A0AC60PN58_IXOPE|nr:hypothetical protein HPB47_001893 [Ixodes persulcatus]
MLSDSSAEDKGMDAAEFRVKGCEMVDYIARYLETISERRVTPQCEPGYLKDQLPAKAPDQPEDWDRIMADVERYIMPGVTHWQHPHFHAYFPAGNSYPSILADMLSDGIGCVGFSWAASPACTELEVIMLDWIGKMINLPEDFLCLSGNSKGGGVIQSSASECVLVTLLAARYTTIKKLKQEQPFVDEGVLLSKLMAYCSKEAHSCVEKAAMIGFVKLRILDTDEKFQMRGSVLAAAIEEDRKAGFIPFFVSKLSTVTRESDHSQVSATLGTTSCCSFDALAEIGPLCQKEDTWLHVDAAYAGSAFICPDLVVSDVESAVRRASDVPDSFARRTDYRKRLANDSTASSNVMMTYWVWRDEQENGTDRGATGSRTGESRSLTHSRKMAPAKNARASELLISLVQVEPSISNQRSTLYINADLRRTDRRVACKVRNVCIKLSRAAIRSGVRTVGSEVGSEDSAIHLPPSGPPKILQSCFDIDRSRSEAYLQARTLHSSSPETTKPCRMDTQETLSEQEWRLVGSDQHLKDNITVVMKFTDGTALGTLPPDTIGNNAERKDTFIKIRTIQNRIAIDTYRQSAAEKILRLQEVQMHGQRRSLIVYQASGKDEIKGVINGIQVSVPDEIIQRSLEVQGAADPPSAKNRIVKNYFDGSRLPRYALYGRVVMRLYPYRPRSLFCPICAIIGHRAVLCPNKPHFTTCLNCGTKLPPGSSENTPHNCEIQCQNCDGEHPANYPQCPARQEADHARREEERNRKRRQQAPPKKNPETHTRGRSRNRDRSQRRRSKSATGIQWPSLPTNNRYSSLRSPERARSKSKDPKKQDDSRPRKQAETYVKDRQVPLRNSSTTQRSQIHPWNGRS